MNAVRIAACLLAALNTLAIYPQSPGGVKPPLPPTPPVLPVMPVVPSSEKPPAIPLFPKMPELPPMPVNPDGAENSEIKLIEKQRLTVSEAYPGGNTGRQAAASIDFAEHFIYSDNSRDLKVYFKNGLQYVYYLKIPRNHIKVDQETVRISYTTTIQAGKEILLDRYTSEAYIKNNDLISITIIGNGSVVVVMKFGRL